MPFYPETWRQKQMKFKKKCLLLKFGNWKVLQYSCQDRPKIFAGQNEKLPVFSDSPAVFMKTDIT